MNESHILISFSLLKEHLFEFKLYRRWQLSFRVLFVQLLHDFLSNMHKHKAIGDLFLFVYLFYIFGH